MCSSCCYLPALDRLHQSNSLLQRRARPSKCVAWGVGATKHPPVSPARKKKLPSAKRKCSACKAATGSDECTIPTCVDNATENRCACSCWRSAPRFGKPAREESPARGRTHIHYTCHHPRRSCGCGGRHCLHRMTERLAQWGALRAASSSAAARPLRQLQHRHIHASPWHGQGEQTLVLIMIPSEVLEY